jgi:thioester reductase-like protein
MKIFITGATGYLGSYVASILLKKTDARLALLVRGKSRAEQIEKLWRALQLHQSAEEFSESLSRIDIVGGDLTFIGPRLGIDEKTYADLSESVDSVLHIAASLNRKSEKACLNTNLRGTLGVIKLARSIKEKSGLDRFSHVSTVAVSGHRDREVVTEDASVDWGRSDYDPYGRTKKFCEHMARELLPDVPLTFFRPSIVMGDSRRVETTQFDMVQAFCVLADMPVVPIKPDTRLDIVHADYVAGAIAKIHLDEKPAYDIYNLSSGTGSLHADRIARALVAKHGGRSPRFVPQLENPFSKTVDALMNLPKDNSLFHVASLLKVFLPYITYDTVFDNARVTEAMGFAPTPFDEYCAELYAWAKSVNYKYPYKPLPEAIAKKHVAEVARG